MNKRFFAVLPFLAALAGGCKTQDLPPEPSVSTLPRWVEEAVFYQVWPRSFQDTDGDGNGDFKGLTQRLDYMSELGINAIWLTPMFESPSYHGYDFEDQYKVEKDYGTEEDFVNFLNAAKQRGIRVIADLVLNHISRQNEWFKRSEMRDPVYDKFFIWRKDIPEKDWAKPWTAGSPKDVWHWSETRKEYYYGVFSNHMPDLNLTNPAVVAEVKKLAKYWMDKGFSGFRLDAARYMIENGGGPIGQADTPESLTFWRDFRKFTDGLDPNSLLVGEVWADLPTTAKYSQKGKGLGLCFDFDFGNQVVKSMGGKLPMSATFGSAGAASGRPLRLVLQENVAKKTESGVSPGFFSPFLTNHDQDRISRLLGDIPHKTRVASTLLLTFVGTPFIYYGEEIGMKQPEGGDDMYKRTPMLWDTSLNAGFSTASTVWIDDPKWFPWRKNHTAWWNRAYGIGDANFASQTVAGQKSDPNSLWNHYRKLIAIRHAHAEFQSHASSSFQILPSADTAVYYERRVGEKASRVAINLLDNASNTVKLPSDGEYTDLLSGRRFKGPDLTIAPAEILVLKASTK